MKTPRILIVEDQREVSRLLRSALETLEHHLEVVEIPSGEEAILYSSRHPIDLLVADYRLPGMTGVELMRKVRTKHPEVKIILITGQTDPKIRKEIAEAGADGFFLKPVVIADFLDAVERLLGLVETMLPPEPIAVPNGNNRRLPDLLVGLRQELGATAVLLLDDSGHVLARAGDLPNLAEETLLLSALLAIHSAGQKISRWLEQTSLSSWLVFDGGAYDLVFTPVEENHALIVVGEKIADEKTILETVRIVSDFRRSVGESLIKVSRPSPDAGRPAYQEPRTTPLEVVEQNLRELEPLFQGKKKFKTDELNRFWEQAADEHRALTSPDVLSYDQARQLGLVPADDDNV
ncbi:MAG: response regulator [Anaerolineales bacterium]|nr:response regulator [Anaerolineales bacterium]MCX7608185.1 response regulator [Anaerolineales bacterium]MDW8226354.1 response regulator [Anaerolineales bacterium]